MKKVGALLLPTLLLALPLIAMADSWDDESGQGKGRGHERREYKEEYWDGNCKVKRKQDKNGEYEEERKCRPLRSGYHAERREYQEEYRDGDCKVKRKQAKNGEYEEERKCKGSRHGGLQQAPIYMPASPAIVVEPGITVHGTVRIPH
ncbi:hypothetical protein [Noviherbaspirillum saxi]|uniref:hypothetical protein n=1 Tax=Noviherbaspirillum saxi TaxID=2320863 RepID=UPI0018F5A72D|nr:hypothetical protein [Noviherbaspirillum saxi]